LHFTAPLYGTIDASQPFLHPFYRDVPVEPFSCTAWSVSPLRYGSHLSPPFPFLDCDVSSPALANIAVSLLGVPDGRLPFSCPALTDLSFYPAHIRTMSASFSLDVTIYSLYIRDPSAPSFQMVLSHEFAARAAFLTPPRNRRCNSVRERFLSRILSAAYRLFSRNRRFEISPLSRLCQLLFLPKPRRRLSRAIEMDVCEYPSWLYLFRSESPLFFTLCEKLSQYSSLFPEAVLF